MRNTQLRRIFSLTARAGFAGLWGHGEGFARAASNRTPLAPQDYTTMNLIDPTSLDQAREMLRKHLPAEEQGKTLSVEALEFLASKLKADLSLQRMVSSQLVGERDRYKAQLDQLESDLAQRDARIAELERSRPVGDWPEARKLREAWDALDTSGRQYIAEPQRNLEPERWYSFRRALGLFLDSAPPASAPSDDAAHYKAVAQQNAAALTECQRERDERTRQVAQLQDELCDARYARDKALAELAALKSAPVRFERDVDVELCKALAETPAAAEESAWWSPNYKRLGRALKAWLAAPLSAGDEYTRAAVAAMEKWCSPTFDAKGFTVEADAFHALWAARHSAAASAPEGEKAAPAFNASDWTSGKVRAFNEMTASEVRAAIEESTFDSKAVAPAPADGERVTVYVLYYGNGNTGGIYSEAERATSIEKHGLVPEGAKWLALDARVVREGGAS